jgi:hypothetical protein
MKGGRKWRLWACFRRPFHHTPTRGPRRLRSLLAFDCTSEEKAAHGHVVYRVSGLKRRQRVSKTASIVPEMSVVL